METRFNRFDRNYEIVNENGGSLAIFNHPGRSLGAQRVRDTSKSELDQAHLYILKNCDEVQPFLEEYSRIQAPNNHGVCGKKWCENFTKWFKSQVTRLYEHDKTKEMEDLLSLARGPKQYVISFSGYVVNGFRFHIEEREKRLRTQNSGVVVIGNTGLGDANVDYYGILTEILELQYLGGNRVVLFRCKWCDVYDKVRGVKEDELRFVSVNFKRQLKTNKPFVLASQARQVFYATNHVNKGWHVVLKSQPHNSYEMSFDPNNDDHEDEAYQQGELFKPGYNASTSKGASDKSCEQRMDMEPAVVEVPLLKETNKGTRKRRKQ